MVYDFIGKSMDKIPVGASVKYDDDRLKVYFGDIELGSSPFVLPYGVSVKILEGKLVEVTDNMGIFVERSMFGGDEQSESILFCPYFNGRELGMANGEVVWDYTIGDTMSSTKKLDGHVRSLMLYGSWKDEFDTGTVVLSSPELPGNLLLRGPNRIGLYEATNGHSSVFIDPDNLTIELGRLFDEPNVTSEIVEGSLRDGYIIIKDTPSTNTPENPKYALWRLDFQFGNKDPEESYRSERLERVGFW